MYSTCRTPLDFVWDGHPENEEDLGVKCRPPSDTFAIRLEAIASRLEAIYIYIYQSSFRLTEEVTVLKSEAALDQWDLDRRKDYLQRRLWPHGS